MSEPIPPRVLKSFIERQALLWVCQRYDLKQGEQSHDYSLPANEVSLRYRRTHIPSDPLLCDIYWEGVWTESPYSELISCLKAGGAQKRGAVILASASDAEARVSPHEFLPVWVLPGLLDDSATPDARYGTDRARVRDRIADVFAGKLSEFVGRTLIVVGAREKMDLVRLFNTLEDARHLDLYVVVVWPPASGEPPLGPVRAGLEIKIFNGDEAEFARALHKAGVPKADELPRWAIRMGKKIVRLRADQARHILERFALVLDRDLLEPDDFTLDDLREFLEGNIGNWRPFSASVPVERAYRSEKDTTLLEELRHAAVRVSADEPETFTHVVQLPAVGGAGATTLVRTAGFQMARDGYPTLFLRPEQVEIDSEDILSFATALVDAGASSGVKEHVPILIVLDVDHAGLPFVGQITQLLNAHSRRAVVLQVVPTHENNLAEQRHRKLTRVRPLFATLAPGEVESCERNFSRLIAKWNLPIEPKTVQEWTSYEFRANWHRTNESSVFWVALRFFLLEGMPASEQDAYANALGLWIQKRSERVTDRSARQLLEYVACLSSFRIVAPIWSVLRPITGGMFSSSIVDSLKQTSDLVAWSETAEDLETQVLRFIHPVLALEYLRQSNIRVYDAAERLAALMPVFANLSSAQKGDVWLAETVAVAVVAPTDSGPVDWMWRLNFFDILPPLLRDQSKALLHHWAICLYKSAGAELPPTDRRARIESAIERLETAIKLPRRVGRDENPSHLYNTLGTAYSRYASVLSSTDDQKARKAWDSACHAFEKSIELGFGVNVEALLAFSFRLLAHAEEAGATREQHTADVAQALSLLDEAEQVLLEATVPSSEAETEIHSYRARGFEWLERGAGTDYLKQLQREAASDLGFYCEARLIRRSDSGEEGISKALDALKQAEQVGIPLRPASLRLKFTLLRSHPKYEYDFATQRAVLQALETSGSSGLRTRELFHYAVLCYQAGDYKEGAARFKRLRDEILRTGNAPPRTFDVLRDPQHPDRPRLTHIKVQRITTERRAEGWVDDLGQRVPLVPRQFSSQPKVGEVAQCVIRFTFFGPLAIPPRFESRSPGDKP